MALNSFARTPYTGPIPANAVELREELDRLNLELRELRSTDYAVRAYIETWLAVLSGLVTGKLIYDWHHTHGKPPMLAIPVAGLCLYLLADCILLRFKQRFVARDEERRLARQLELRRVLRVDEATFPPSKPAAADVQPPASVS